MQYCRFHLSSSDSICVSIVQCLICSYFWCRKEVWWLEYRCLKACSVNPICSFFSFSLVTTALYTIDFSWHLPFIGQLDLPRQLHLQSWGVDASTVLLWLLMILATFGTQLELTLRVLRLKILLSFDCFLKCLLARPRKRLPTFVATDLLNGGLNQVTFLLRCPCFVWACVLWYDSGVEYPLLFRASWYVGKVCSYTCSLDDMLALGLLMASGIFWIILGGWFDSLFTSQGVSFGFL